MCHNDQVEASALNLFHTNQRHVAYSTMGRLSAHFVQHITSWFTGCTSVTNIFVYETSVTTGKCIHSHRCRCDTSKSNLIPPPPPCHVQMQMFLHLYVTLQQKLLFSSGRFYHYRVTAQSGGRKKKGF